MSNAALKRENQNEASFIRLSPEERTRETTLREQFASFWGTATGTPRQIYDTFIGSSPLVDAMSLEAVDEQNVHGWWVRPSQSEPGQAILFLHGGGYVVGSATAYRGFASQIASRANVPALVIDYPLAPEASVPAAPNAAIAAWRYLVAKGFKQIAIVGDSAGGGLTLVTLAQLTHKPQGLAPIAGAVFSPWADLTLTSPSMTDASAVDPLIGLDYLQNCAKEVLGKIDARDPIASPLFGDLHGLPPLLIQVGTDERLLDDSKQYAARAKQAGVNVQLEIWEGMHHVFQLDVKHLESSRQALDRTARFLSNAFEPRQAAIPTTAQL